VRELLTRVEIHGNRCLDIACMDGLISLLLARRGASEVVAWDRVPRSHAAELSAEFGAGLSHVSGGTIHDICNTFRESIHGRSSKPFPPFDVVVCSGLLYHVFEPLGTLLDVRSCVRDGGVLVVETAAIFDTGHAMHFNADGRFYRQAAAANYWFPTLELLGYLLEFCRLMPVAASWFMEDATKETCRIAVVCRAERSPTSTNEWLDYHLQCGPGCDAGMNYAAHIDWERIRAYSSTLPDVPVTGGEPLLNLWAWATATPQLGPARRQRLTTLMIEDIE
jgi:SAM-dependent methyltransferase